MPQEEDSCEAAGAVLGGAAGGAAAGLVLGQGKDRGIVALVGAGAGALIGWGNHVARNHPDGERMIVAALFGAAAALRGNPAPGVIGSAAVAEVAALGLESMGSQIARTGWAAFLGGSLEFLRRPSITSPVQGALAGSAAYTFSQATEGVVVSLCRKK